MITSSSISKANLAPLSLKLQRAHQQNVFGLNVRIILLQD